jgi:hypothetical protein
MLRSLKVMHGYIVSAKDADIGKVHDFYFHDDNWIIRYLVVDTGHWLPGRRVLIAPGALGKPDWASMKFPVALTREQVEKSPPIDTDEPVSRQQEADLHNHYGWPFYWVEPGIGVWPPYVSPMPVAVPAKPSESANRGHGDPHLQSQREVVGYHIHASDGAFGHVEDFIADDAQWVIRYLVVHTGKWLPAKKVLLSPKWLGEIRYAQREVTVALSRDKILNCPEYFPGAAVNREYEERLYDYYGRPVYWTESSPTEQGQRS